MADEERTEEVRTMTVQDAQGNDIEVEVGADGENPVSPNNPPAKSLPEADRDSEFTAPEDTTKVAEEAAEMQGHADYDPTDAADSLPPTSPAPEGTQDATAQTEDQSGAEQTEGQQETVTKPSTTDAKSAWVDYAVSQGMSAEEANSHTKQELIDTYNA